ncbi:MAG: hypothetical protein A2V65_08300 [Deltaproteobacteria bacterium RBG_13_49_15]|nr:MAG: hypothetical protein A2V65_08300 [Deltaproteobacteria bacterium RBG_13_49_15]
MLNYRYISGGRTFIPLFDIESDMITFFKCFEAAGIDSRMVNEHIRTFFLLNESEPFSLIKPLN